MREKSWTNEKERTIFLEDALMQAGKIIESVQPIIEEAYLMCENGTAKHKIIHALREYEKETTVTPEFSRRMNLPRGKSRLDQLLSSLNR